MVSTAGQLPLLPGNVFSFHLHLATGKVNMKGIKDHENMKNFKLDKSLENAYNKKYETKNENEVKCNA